MARARIDRERGSILVAIVAAVAIVFLAVLAKSALQDIEHKLTIQTGVSKNLDVIETALANFVAQHRRLPCPAIGTIASGAANAGVESPNPPTGTCAPANQRTGVVPWVTLGISEVDASDPWNGRITYRVYATLAGIAAPTDMSWCDPAGTPTGVTGAAVACTPGCTGAPAACTSALNFLYSKGLQVQDGSGVWLNNPSPAWAGAPAPPPPASTGAAYVLISHGPTGAGAYNKGGAAGPLFLTQPGSAVVGTSETPNQNNQPLAAGTIFMDAPQSTSLTAAHFDDYLRHPTITSVVNSVSLGTRTH